jgi:hypothetical protein
VSHLGVGTVAAEMEDNDLTILVHQSSRSQSKATSFTAQIISALAETIPRLNRYQTTPRCLSSSLVPRFRSGFDQKVLRRQSA